MIMSTEAIDNKYIILMEIQTDSVKATLRLEALLQEYFNSGGVGYGEVI